MSYRRDLTAKSRFIDGDIINGYIQHRTDKNSRIIFQFSQPYIIGSIRLLLNEECSYYVRVATNNKNWSPRLFEDNVSGWRLVTFPKQPVTYIKVVGTKAPSNVFRLRQLECPAV
uniref:MAM domain-containing protein n=1 Tax=Panagrellus redivivus TaxID=6233 RepID=A0A7E4W5H5_PANRE